MRSRLTRVVMILALIAVAAGAASSARMSGAQAPATASSVNVPTYSKDVAPIVQKNCQVCHRPGEAGPFSLLTYGDVRRQATKIADALVEGKMPPWFADPHYGKFSNAMGLSASEIDTHREVGRWRHRRKAIRAICRSPRSGSKVGASAHRTWCSSCRCPSRSRRAASSTISTSSSRRTSRERRAARAFHATGAKRRQHAARQSADRRMAPRWDACSSTTRACRRITPRRAHRATCRHTRSADPSPSARDFTAL